MADALERLKNRNRPSVPNRDTSLTVATPPGGQDISISRNLETEILTHPEEQKFDLPRNEQPLQTKQSTLRLEIGVSDRLQNLCRENAICREVLIEAMFEYCEESSEALQTVLSKAKEKNEHRQQLANQKRAKSMMQRFGQ